MKSTDGKLCPTYRPLRLMAYCIAIFFLETLMAGLCKTKEVVLVHVPKSFVKCKVAQAATYKEWTSAYTRRDHTENMDSLLDLVTSTKKPISPRKGHTTGEE